MTKSAAAPKSTNSGDRGTVGRAEAADLMEPWPAFLDLLGHDRAPAFEALYHFARRLFRQHPPRAIRGLQPADREDALHDVVYHCCKDDFRVLRSYRNQGKPFARWLRRVAQWRVLDDIRRRDREPSSGEPLDENLRDERDASDRRVDMERALEVTLDCLHRLDPESRVLLQAGASGMTPREMTRLLGWSSDQNGRASDRCRYCRKKLKKMLREAGIDLSDVVDRE